MIVIDASALVKVLLKEKGWENVPLDPNVATLDYALVEGMNAIWKAVKAERTTEEGAKNLIVALKLIGGSITLFNAKDFFERGLEIALKENIEIHDALYIALAEALNAELYTADNKQCEAAKKYVIAKLVS